MKLSPGRGEESQSERGGEAVRIQFRGETLGGESKSESEEEAREQEPEVFVYVQDSHGFAALGNSSPGRIRLKEAH